MATPQQQLTALQQQITNLQAQVATLSSLSPQRKAVLPDIDKFDGSPHKWDTWRPMIKAKLRVDGAAIGDPIAQFYYVYFALESKVQAMVLPQLSYAEEEEIWNPQSILDQLARVCDNPNKLNEAKDRLHAVKQGDDSLSTYIAKFERLLFEARGHNWDNDRKISAFRYGLNSTIKNRLAQQLELPDIYADFLFTVQKLSSRSGNSSFTPSSGISNAHYHSNSHPHQPSTQRHGGDPMDISRIGGEINALDFYEIDANGQPTGIRHPDPIRVLQQRQEAADRLGLDLNEIELEPPSITRKHIAKRPASRQANNQQSYRDSGACLRCGSFDHWLSACLEPAPPSINSRSAGTSGKRVTIAGWDDDDDKELYSD